MKEIITVGAPLIQGDVCELPPYEVRMLGMSRVHLLNIRILQSKISSIYAVTPIL